MNQQNDNNLGLSVDIGNELSKNMTIHTNVKQEIIISTSDKIKLVLIKTRKILLSQRDWWTPFGLLISFIATLCTADFKEALGLDKNVWHALFLLLTIASAIWLLIALYKLWKNKNLNFPDDIIQQIQLKESSPPGKANASDSDSASPIVFSQSINILSATYLWNGGQIDVTSKIKELVSKGIYTIMVDPSTFGIPDPAHRILKTLKIHCKINDKEKEFSHFDGEIFTIG